MNGSLGAQSLHQFEMSGVRTEFLKSYPTKPVIQPYSRTFLACCLVLIPRLVLVFANKRPILVEHDWLILGWVLLRHKVGRRGDSVREVGTNEERDGVACWKSRFGCLGNVRDRNLVQSGDEVVWSRITCQYLHTVTSTEPRTSWRMTNRWRSVGACRRC